MTTPLAYVASSGKSIGIRCLDSSNNPVNIAAVASLNDQQTLSLSSLPSGGTFTLTFDGQTTAPIAASTSLPAKYALFQFTVTPGHAQTVAIDIVVPGGGYSAMRVDVIDGLTGSILGPVLAADCEYDGNTWPPTISYTAVSLDGTSTSYMHTLATVTPASSTVVLLVTFGAGGVLAGSNAINLTVATCTDNVTATVQKCGVKDAGFSLSPSIAGNANFNNNSAFYNGYQVQIFHTSLSVGGPAITVLASAIQSALQALPNIGSSGVTVADSSGLNIGPYPITFVGPLALQYQNPITSTSSAITITHNNPGGNAPTIKRNGGSPIKLYDFVSSDGVTTLGNPVVGNIRPSGLWQFPQQTQIKRYPINAGVNSRPGNWQTIAAAPSSYSKQAMSTSEAGDSYTQTCEQFQNNNGLSPITVDVYITWVPDATLSTSVPVVIQSSTEPVDGSTSYTTLFTGTINQSITPSDLLDQGVYWKRVGSVTIQYPAIDILVTITNASGTIALDAIQIRPTSTDNSLMIAPGDSVTLTIPDGFITTVSGPLTGVTNLPVTNGAGRSYPTLPTFATMGVGTNVAADNIVYGTAGLYSSLHARADFSPNYFSVQGKNVVLGALNYPVSATVPYIDQIQLNDNGNGAYPHFANQLPPNSKPGMYVLEWTGVGDCEMVPLGNGYSFVEQTAYQVINPAGNRRVYLISVVEGVQYSPTIFIRVYASGPAVAGVYPYDFGNLRCWQPDPSDPTGMTPWLTNRTLFYGPALSCLQGSTTLRFLDWTGVNGVSTQEYSDYCLPGQLCGPKRTLSGTIVSISPCTSGQLFYPAHYVSVIVQTATPHGLLDYSDVNLTTTSTLTFSTGQTLSAGSIYAEQVRVIDSTHFQALLTEVNAPATLSATVTGGSFSKQLGLSQGPYTDQFLLCNELNAGCHLNLSPNGSADCHYQEGVAAGQNLNPNLTLYLEFGNEPWNYQFPSSVGLLSQSWVETGNGDYGNLHGMVVAAAAAFAQFEAGLASTGWSGTVVWGYGSGYEGTNLTSSICSTAQALGLRLDAIYLGTYFQNHHIIGPEVNFNRLFDTADADQSRDHLCLYIQDGGWQAQVAAHRPVMDSFGFTNAKIIGYEGMIEQLTPGSSQVASYERSALVAFHPEYYAVMAGLYLPALEQGGMTNINLYYIYGNGNDGFHPLESRQYYTWDICLRGGQTPGTGNWTTDAINITNPTAFDRIKSEAGGGVKLWNSLRAHHVTARNGDKTYGKNKRQSRRG